MAEHLCGNRSPISGECMIGCQEFGSCRRGTERPLAPRDLVNPLTGELYKTPLPTKD